MLNFFNEKFIPAIAKKFFTCFIDNMKIRFLSVSPAKSAMSRMKSGCKRLINSTYSTDSFTSFNPIEYKRSETLE